MSFLLYALLAFRTCIHVPQAEQRRGEAHLLLTYMLHILLSSRSRPCYCYCAAAAAAAAAVADAALARVVVVDISCAH